MRSLLPGDNFAMLDDEHGMVATIASLYSAAPR
jgi:hypothetical protein